MSGAAQRVSEIEELFLRCRGDWRDFFFELESGEGSLQSEDPWRDIDAFLAGDPERREEFGRVLREMIERGEPDEQAQALSIAGACREPFDLSFALSMEKQLAEDLETHVALLLAIGQRRFEDGKDAVLRALDNPSRRHAALIALAQLDPEQAAPLGRPLYEKDRTRILSILSRPLGENEYVTFYEMAKSTLQVRGKDGLNLFLRRVAGEDDAMGHELAQLARRLIRQLQDEDLRA